MTRSKKRRKRQAASERRKAYRDSLNPEFRILYRKKAQQKVRAHYRNQRENNQRRRIKGLRAELRIDVVDRAFDIRSIQIRRGKWSPKTSSLFQNFRNRLDPWDQITLGQIRKELEENYKVEIRKPIYFLQKNGTYRTVFADLLLTPIDGGCKVSVFNFFETRKKHVIEASSSVFTRVYNATGIYASPSNLIERLELIKSDSSAKARKESELSMPETAGVTASRQATLGLAYYRDTVEKANQSLRDWNLNFVISDSSTPLPKSLTGKCRSKPYVQPKGVKGRHLIVKKRTKLQKIAAWVLSADSLLRAKNPDLEVPILSNRWWYHQKHLFRNLYPYRLSTVSPYGERAQSIERTLFRLFSPEKAVTAFKSRKRTKQFRLVTEFWNDQHSWVSKHLLST